MEIWKATIKERGNERVLTPTYSIPDDFVHIIDERQREYQTRKFLEKFWGLDNPDVEWYKLEKIENMKTCCICGKLITGYGNNPYPVKESGECCNECNATKVIPARLQMLNK